MVPAAVVGLFSIYHSGIVFWEFNCGRKSFVVLGVLLYFANRTPAESQPLSTRHAWWIGLAQAIAILPDSPKWHNHWNGLAPKVNARPQHGFVFNGDSLIFGNGKSIRIWSCWNSIAPLQLGIGFLTAFIAGVLACKWMIALVNKSQLVYFSIYCAAAGIFALVYGSF